MSTYWGYHCRTDDESSPHWFNHGEWILRDAIKLWPHIQAIHEVGQGAFWVQFPSESSGPPSLTEWLFEHASHDLELANEYGDTEPVAEPVQVGGGQ